MFGIEMRDVKDTKSREVFFEKEKASKETITESMWLALLHGPDDTVIICDRKVKHDSLCQVPSWTAAGTVTVSQTERAHS